MTDRAVRMAVRTAERAFSSPWITGGLVVSQILAYVILIPLAGRVAEQARGGAAARDRSCALRDPGLKLYRDAADRGVITSSELQKFAATARQVCGR